MLYSSSYIYIGVNTPYTPYAPYTPYTPYTLDTLDTPYTPTPFVPMGTPYHVQQSRTQAQPAYATEPYQPTPVARLRMSQKCGLMLLPVSSFVMSATLSRRPGAHRDTSTAFIYLTVLITAYSPPHPNPMPPWSHTSNRRSGFQFAINENQTKYRHYYGKAKTYAQHP
jgi:hypothetical protein